jgi:hypothetical protein
VAHPPPLTYPPTSNTISSLFGGHLFKLKWHYMSSKPLHLHGLLTVNES